LLRNLVENSNHDVLELRWNALAAHLNVVSIAGMFQAHPLSLIVERELSQLIRELKAYLAGRVTLGAPAGIITQDGLNLFGLDDFTAQLSLGLGYLYNLDLCGQYRFSLNPARDAVVWDEGSKRVCMHLHGQVGRRLGTWFRDLGIMKEQVERYAESAPEPLRDAVWSSYTGRT
jgi:hypothetical protein